MMAGYKKGCEEKQGRKEGGCGCSWSVRKAGLEGQEELAAEEPLRAFRSYEKARGQIG